MEAYFKFLNHYELSSKIALFQSKNKIKCVSYKNLNEVRQDSQVLDAKSNISEFKSTFLDKIQRFHYFTNSRDRLLSIDVYSVHPIIHVTLFHLIKY